MRLKAMVEDLTPQRKSAAGLQSCLGDQCRGKSERLNQAYMILGLFFADRPDSGDASPNATGNLLIMSCS